MSLPPAADLPILLIGPRGAGKSTLGSRLAGELGWEFVDADLLLEQRAGRSIAAWLPADETGFRAAEAALLRELALRPRAVVALGGGVVEDPASRAFLAQHPRVLALRAPLETLVQRQSGGDRPPLTGLPVAEEAAAVWMRRADWYETAASGRWVETGAGLETAWSRLLAAARAVSK